MSGKQGYSDGVVHDLLRQYRGNGDPRLRERLVDQMRPLVQSVARKFAGREPLEDLESEGFVGLLRAIDRFVPERGARFSTFATHLIAGQIRHYLRDRGHLIRQPAWLQEVSARVDRVTAHLEQRLQRTPTILEIAEASNLTEDAVEELLAARRAAQVVRMQTPSGEADADYLEVNPEKIQSREYVTFELPVEDRILVDAAWEKLKALEKKVVYYFFYQDFNKSEIARHLGISPNYTGHVLKKALKTLRDRLPGDAAVLAPGAASGGDSVMDAATGLYSLAHFNRRVSEEVTRAQRSGHPVSLCCIQLPDGASEAVLREAALLLKSGIRRMDVAGRTGPREVAVLFPGTGGVVSQVAMRLSEHLQPAARAGVRTGCARFPEDTHCAADLLSAARAAVPPAVPTQGQPLGRARAALSGV